MTKTRSAVLNWGRRFTTATSGVRLTDPHMGLRGFSRGFAERIQLCMSDMAYASELVGLIAAERARYCEIPVTVRYTGMSIAFNGGGVIGGALTPLAAQRLSEFGYVPMIGLLLSVAGLLTLLGVMLGRPSAAR